MLYYVGLLLRQKTKEFIMNDVLFPDIKVRLTGSDGNAFAILGKVRQALRRANVPAGQIAEFMDEATGGDYNDLLCVCMRWVDVS
jgi:hypothetical protein